MHICKPCWFFSLSFSLSLSSPSSPYSSSFLPLLSPPPLPSPSSCLFLPLFLSHSTPTLLSSFNVYTFSESFIQLRGWRWGDQRLHSLRVKLAEAILKFQLSRKDMEEGLRVLLFPFFALELYSVTNFCVSEILLFRVRWGKLLFL